MSDRTYLAMLIGGGFVCLVALVWTVLAVTGPPRDAHRSEIEPVSAAQFERLATEIAGLSQRVDQMGGGGGGAVRATGPSGPVGERQPLQLAEGELGVVWADGELPVIDPLAAAWESAPAVTVTLERQDQAMPVLDSISVRTIDVRSLTDGRRIAWRLAWDDSAADYHLEASRFCDAVAIQFPLAPNAAYTMGAEEFPVQIIQWKAIWQKDIDSGFQDVQDLHPNYWADLYWFAEGEFPYRVPDAFQSTESRDWFIAYRAGNPMAEFDRETPVQELIAEGFGTLTHQPESASIGQGVWREGRWYVVFSRPLETNDTADYQFRPGVRDLFAIAVWEGSSDNVGARHQQSQWTVFEVQQ